MIQQLLDLSKTTANSSQTKPKIQNQFQTASQLVMMKEKLISLSCYCEVEKNGYKDLEIRNKDKNKIISVFKIKETNNEGVVQEKIKFIIKYQKTGDIALEFTMSDITGIYAQKQNEGMISFTLRIKDVFDNKKQNQQSKAKNLNKQIVMLPQETQYKVLLSKMEPSLLQGLCKILKEETMKRQNNSSQNIANNGQSQLVKEETKKPQISQTNESQESKKRKFQQMTNANERMIINPRLKIKKFNENVNKVNVQNTKEELIIQTYQNTGPIINIDSLPWDVLRIILDYTPRNILKNLRVNKQFYNLVNKRKLGLTFSQKEISQRVFFNILEKSKSIKYFAITLTHFRYVTQSIIEKNLVCFPNLVVLDLLSCQNINEASLSRLINACTKSLKVFKTCYVGNGLGLQSITSLAKCRQLNTLMIGEHQQHHKVLQTVDKLTLLKRLFNHKQFSLEYLTLYHADKYIIDILSEKQESESLLQLCIVNFIQNNNIKLEELENLRKFKNLQSLNLCSTYFPLEFQVQLPDAQNDQQLSVAGNRELELILFSFKNNLRVLHLGDYAYDELLNYIAELCQKIEKLEINSEKVTDRGLTQIFRKLENLKFIDLSGCPNFSGLAVFDSPSLPRQLRRFIFALSGYEKQKVQEKLETQLPDCVIELNLKKNYKSSK